MKRGIFLVVALSLLWLGSHHGEVRAMDYLDYLAGLSMAGDYAENAFGRGYALGSKATGKPDPGFSFPPPKEGRVDVEGCLLKETNWRYWGTSVDLLSPETVFSLKPSFFRVVGGTYWVEVERWDCSGNPVNAIVSYTIMPEEHSFLHIFEGVGTHELQLEFVNQAGYVVSKEMVFGVQNPF